MKTIHQPLYKGLDARAMADVHRQHLNATDAIGPIFYSAKAHSPHLLHLHTDAEHRIIDTHEGVIYSYPLPLRPSEHLAVALQASIDLESLRARHNRLGLTDAFDSR